MTIEPIQRKLQFVLEKYGIQPRENVTLGTFSMGNEVFFITGKDGKRYVLKNCLKNNSPALIAVETAAIRHLLALGCGAPEVVRALDGSEYVLYNGDHFIMYRHLKGAFLSPDSRPKPYHYAQSVRGLAIYHRAISGLDPSLDTDRIKSYDYERSLRWFLELKETLLADTSGRPSVQGMLGLIDRYADLARRLPSFLPPEAVKTCEKLLIHGDLHMYNMAFLHGRFSAVYDFDFIRRDLKTFDVAWALGTVERRFLEAEFGKSLHDPAFKPDLDRLSVALRRSLVWFVRVYRKEYRLSDEEISIIPGLRIAITLHNARFFRMELSEEERTQMLGWMGWSMDMADNMIGRYPAVVDQAIAELRR